MRAIAVNETFCALLSRGRRKARADASSLDFTLPCSSGTPFKPWLLMKSTRVASNFVLTRMVPDRRTRLSARCEYNRTASTSPLHIACDDQSSTSSRSVHINSTSPHSLQATSFTVEDALSAVGFGRFHFSLLAYAGLAWASEAMELLLLSFVGPAAATEWEVGAQWESAVASVVFVGMMGGAYAWGILADAKGRRFAFAATAALTCLAGLASAAAPSFSSLLLLRAAVGVGLGGAPVVFSLFLEFVPAKERGFWSMVLSAFWTLGSMAEAALAWAIMPTLGWRWLVALSSLPLLLLLLFLPLLPESPRFLLVKGQSERALAILQRVAAANGRTLPEGTLCLSPPSPDEQPDIAPSSSTPVMVSDSGEADVAAAGGNPGYWQGSSAKEAVLVDGAALAARPFDSQSSNAGDGDERRVPGSAESDTWDASEGKPLLVNRSSSVVGDKVSVTSFRRPGVHSVAPTNTSSGSSSSSSSSSWFSTLFCLLQPPHRSSTLLLWAVFFANAFTYYGLVLLTTQLAGNASSCTHLPAPDVAAAAAAAPAPAAVAAAGGGDGVVHGPRDGLYSDIFVTSAAEFPGLLFAALFADRFGRKVTISSLLFTAALATAPLLITTSASLPLIFPGVDASGGTVVSLFVARAAVMGSFQTLFVYAPEVYPTSIRSSGLGIASSFSRLGGIICPFAAVSLVQSCQLIPALLMFVLVPFFAAFATLAFPVETSGRALVDDDSEASGLEE